jgi:D-Tyr-tRNAtyr deacylase
MAAFHPIDPDHMLSRFTLRAGTADGLMERIAEARDGPRAQAVFDATWSAIDPGRTPGFDEIIQAARMSPEP